MGLGDKKPARSSLTASLQRNHSLNRRSINVEDLFRNNTTTTPDSGHLSTSPKASAKSQPNLRYSDVISAADESVPFIDDGAQTSASQEQLNSPEPQLFSNANHVTRHVDAVVEAQTSPDRNHNNRKMENRAMTHEMSDFPPNGDATHNETPDQYETLTPPPSDAITPSETSSTTMTSRRPQVKIDRDQMNQLEFDEMQGAGARPTTTLKESMRDFAKNCECSGRCIKKKITGMFPFLKIPKFYSMPDDLINDTIAGITVGIMQIPQGTPTTFVLDF